MMMIDCKVAGDMWVAGYPMMRQWPEEGNFHEIKIYARLKTDAALGF